MLCSLGHKSAQEEENTRSHQVALTDSNVGSPMTSIIAPVTYVADTLPY